MLSTRARPESPKCGGSFQLEHRTRTGIMSAPELGKLAAATALNSLSRRANGAISAKRFALALISGLADDLFRDVAHPLFEPLFGEFPAQVGNRDQGPGHAHALVQFDHLKQLGGIEAGRVAAADEAFDLARIAADAGAFGLHLLE